MALRFRTALERSELYLVAASMFSFAAVTRYPITSAAAGLLGLVAAVFAMRQPLRHNRSIVAGAGALSLAVVLLTSQEVMARLSVWEPSTSLWLSLAAATGLSAALSIRKPRFDVAVRVLALATAVASTLMILVPNWEPDQASDIYRVHVAAGAAMTMGLNPYSDAVVFESGNPFQSDGSEIVGYPYPTVPLVAYAGTGAFTDPRIVSAVAWLGLLGWLAWASRRGQSRADAALAALVILSTAPIWRFALFMSWTEPLSIALFVGAFWLLQRGRVLPGLVVLGMALASKQYFVFLAPVLAFLGDGRDRRRAWWALGAAAVIAAIPALWGPAEYFNAVVGISSEIGFRPDTQSLNGLFAALGSEFIIPFYLWGPLVIIASVWVGVRIGSLSRLGEAAVVVMPAVFLLTYAFPNYWLLVAALAAVVPVTTAEVEDRAGSMLRARPQLT